MSKFYVGPKAGHEPFPGVEYDVASADAAAAAFCVDEGLPANTVVFVCGLSGSGSAAFYRFAPGATVVTAPPYPV